MSNGSSSEAQSRRVELAQRAIVERPQHVREQYRELILRGTIALGMSPFEAKLAAGAFTYTVKPDPANWSPNANPLAVLWAQSERADGSFIRMTFRNDTQFSEAGSSVFRVVFDQGRAQEITKEGT